MGNEDKIRRTQLHAAVERLCEANHLTWSATVTDANGGRIVVEANAPVPVPEPPAAPAPEPPSEETPKPRRRRSARSRS